MTFKKLTGAFALGLVVLTTGCIHSPVEENWGKSYEAHVAWQTADPTAPANYDASEGLDPETAKRVAERYYEGQEQQKQRRLPTVILNEQ